MCELITHILSSRGDFYGQHPYFTGGSSMFRIAFGVSEYMSLYVDFMILNKEFSMKNIMTMTAAVACAFALTACGGGGDDSGSALSRADEGIWSNLNSAAVAGAGMQAVILSDGSYWGVYGTQNDGAPGVFNPKWVLQGTASIDGSNVSATYIGISLNSYNSYASGTYSGTVSAQNNLGIAFAGYLNTDPLLPPRQVLNMTYDGVYNQPALLSAIAGAYSGYGTNTYGPGNGDASKYNNIQNLTISGSDLTLSDRDGNAILTGTMTPHGTTVNVFDVNLATVLPSIPGGGSGIVNGAIILGYKGILFRTSSGSLKNSIQIVATSGDSVAYYFMGSKQN